METGAAVTTEEPSRPRILRWIVIGLVLAILVATGTAAALVARYQPLEHGSSGGTPSISLPFKDVDNPSEGTTTRVVTYIQGAKLDVDVSIRNDGPWGVTIASVPRQNFGLFHVTEVRRGVLNNCCVATEPFAPFALSPGEDRLLRLHGVVSGCKNYATEGGVIFNSYPVRYRILGITRSTWIESTHEIEIHIPKGYLCTE
jgi:hypothetical protein